MSIDPLQTVLAALEAHSCKPRQSGPHQWLSLCPAHEDRKPSLSVGLGREGQVLLKCFVHGIGLWKKFKKGGLTLGRLSRCKAAKIKIAKILKG